MWGDDDQVDPRPRRRSASSALIPDVAQGHLPDTGHVAMLERPARFNALLETFLGEIRRRR